MKQTILIHLKQNRELMVTFMWQKLKHTHA